MEGQESHAAAHFTKPTAQNGRCNITVYPLLI